MDLLIQRLDRFKLEEGKIGDAHIDQALFDKLRSRVERNEKLEKEEAARELAEEPPLPPAPLLPSALPEQARSSLNRAPEIQLQVPKATPLTKRTEPSTDGLNKLPLAEKNGPAQKEKAVRSPVRGVVAPLSPAPTPMAQDQAIEEPLDDVIEVTLPAPSGAEEVAPPRPAKKRGRPKGSKNVVTVPPYEQEHMPKDSSARETRQRARTNYALRKSVIPTRNRDRTEHST